MDTDLWLKGPYFIEIDTAGQLRVIGPQNHLLFGSVGLYRHQLKIVEVQESGHDHQLVAELNPIGGFWPDPAMGHIRRVRDHIQVVGQDERTFEEVRRRHSSELAPTEVTLEDRGDGPTVTFLRRYGRNFYGTRWSFPKGAKLRRDDQNRGFHIESDLPVRVTCTFLVDPLPKPYQGPLLKPYDLELTTADPKLRPFLGTLLERTEQELEHLVRNNKTSGFDYGTVFPRDWMEAADLGAEDLEPEAVLYMYQAALAHVNEHGAGWHEDIIGEFRYEREQELNRLATGFEELLEQDNPFRSHLSGLREFLDELFVTRLMIDIEPHYLLGLQTVPIEQFDANSIDRLRRVAAFVLRQASERDLITFNKLAAPFRRTRGDEYYGAGNWRDSVWAYKQVHPVIAPYDVNAVFYPQALRIIRQYHQILGVELELVESLIRKWDRVKDWYRFTNADGGGAFALALYHIRTEDKKLKFDTLRVNHLDEAYDHFYGEPTETEAASFARRLLATDYFYTSSGPILVGHGENYTTADYHGKVTWTKQTAYVVAGLERQLARAAHEHWLAETTDLLREALVSTAYASLQAFQQLQAIPELHFDAAGRPRFYNEQPQPEGQMNKVQLWSTTGARRILRAYLRNI